MNITTQAHEPEEPVETIALHQETATVDIRDVITGRVRVSTQVEMHEQVVQSELQSNTVDVTRVAVNQQVIGDPPKVRTEGNVTIVPVFEEVLFIEKRLILKEELHIRKQSTVDAISIPVSLKRQSVRVERLDGNDESIGSKV